MSEVPASAQQVRIYDKGSDGLAVFGTYKGASPDAVADVFAVGCLLLNADNGKLYTNTGTSASPTWSSVSEIVTADIADGAVTVAKLRDTTEARTATADGTGTGAITAPTAAIKFVDVTSAAATNQITLPAITSAGIGQVIYLSVGSNGYELITPASSNNTINRVDSDGTNQLDVAADTVVRCTQISATGWLAETIAAATIAVTAPDND